MAKIGVLGPGGVGGTVAARFAQAGHEVTVVASDSTAAAITANGLSYTGPDGVTTISHPISRAYLAEPVDVLFVAVKATDLLPALQRVARADGVTVVPFLNGVDHMSLLRATFSTADVVAASIAIEAERSRPGVVRQLSAMADIVIADDTSAGARVAELIGSVGFTVATAPNDATVLWRKLCFLAALALSTTATNSAIGEVRAAKAEWVRALVDEATAAAAGHGVQVDAAAVEARLHAMPETMQSSMLRDFRAGRPLELDAIAGPIIRTLGPDRAPATTAAVHAILVDAAGNH